MLAYTMAIGWADMPGQVRADLGNVQFVGIEPVKDFGGAPVAYSLSSLSGQPWGSSVPAFSLALNKQTVAGQNYVQGTISLTENAVRVSAGERTGKFRINPRSSRKARDGHPRPT